MTENAKLNSEIFYNCRLFLVISDDKTSDNFLKTGNRKSIIALCEASKPLVAIMTIVF